jgi:hypothetical protein
MLALCTVCCSSWQFDEPRIVGESNVTHFWMPGVGGIAVVGRDTESLLLTVDENGDGTKPVDCKTVKCPPRNYVERNGTSGWAARPAMAAVPMNALVSNESLAGGFRGFGGIRLDSSNASGCISFTDWVFDEDAQQARALAHGCAPLHGLPRMASKALQIMPSGGTLADGTRLAIAYGAVYNATRDGGDGYSSFLFASQDGGSSWKVRTRFDRTEGMPHAVGCGGWAPPTSGTCGPCEPAFAVLNDGRTVVAVLRIQSGQNLWQAISRDGGGSWTEPAETRAWSVFPQMRALPNGAVVLVAGRPSIGMWQLDLDTFEWGRFVNLAAAHNAALPASAPAGLTFDALEAAVSNRSSPVSSPALTKAYTALAVLPCGSGSDTCSVVVAYDRLANGNGVPPGTNGQADRVFTMRVHVAGHV